MEVWWDTVLISNAVFVIATQNSDYQSITEYNLDFLLKDYQFNFAYRKAEDQSMEVKWIRESFCEHEQ